MTYSNARMYWHLFGGVDPEGQTQRITNLRLRLKIGGTEAHLAGDRYRISVYGREHINSGNLVTLHREYIDLPDIGSVGLDQAWRYWRNVTISKAKIDSANVRCVVVKIEALLEDTAYTPQNEDYVRAYADQSTTADPPPWGVRLISYAINASDLHTLIKPHEVVKDIVSPYWGGSDLHVTGSKLELGQLAFSDIPYSRRDGLDDVNALLDWDYGVWDDEEFYYSPPGIDVFTIDAKDPRIQLSFQSDVHEVYNACRVKYGSKNGRPREVIVHADGSDIASPVKATTIEAPDTIKNESQANRCGVRFLNNHKRATVTGTATLYGINEGYWGDAMLLRPTGKVRIKNVPKRFAGPHKVTKVQLNPTEWSASIEFGVVSRRFDVWLARVAAGARVRQR